MSNLCLELGTTAINRLITQLGFNAQQTVVLGNAIRAAQRTGLDLSGRRGHRQVGNGGVFGFPGAMGDYSGVACVLGHLDGVEGFRQRADLIELNQYGVGDFFIDAFLQNFGVGNKQVVTHQLNFVAQFLGVIGPAVPVAFIKPVFDVNDGVLVRSDERRVGKLFGRKYLAFTSQIVFAIFVEF